MTPKPIVAKTHQWKETEAYMKRLKYIHDTQKQKEEAEAEKKRAAEADRQRRREMWGMRDRVLSKLAQSHAQRCASMARLFPLPMLSSQSRMWECGFVDGRFGGVERGSIRRRVQRRGSADIAIARLRTRFMVEMS